jgi:RNA polymerase sigma factor (sigma-70 family)
MKTKLHEIALGHSPSPAWSDEDLVAECLSGNQQAWTALVSKYKNLVYSVPMKYRMSAEDAADVFQSVWSELYNELAKLRRPGAVRSWLVTVASNQCYRWKKNQRKWGELADPEFDIETLAGDSGTQALHEGIEREQVMREAIQSLPERCQTMVRLLFYSDPPLPYREVAQRLGLAEGSIGFIRGRCLQKLRRNLEDRGF